MNGQIDTEVEVFMAMASSLLLFTGVLFNGVILLRQFEAIVGNHFDRLKVAMKWSRAI